MFLSIVLLLNSYNSIMRSSKNDLGTLKTNCPLELSLLHSFVMTSLLYVVIRTLLFIVPVTEHSVRND